MKTHSYTCIILTGIMLTSLVTPSYAATLLQHGMVVDAENNAPLHGVSVFVGKQSSAVELVVTGSDGRYSFSKNHSPSGTTTPRSGNQTILAIYHPGYAGFTKVLTADPPPENSPVIRLSRVAPASFSGTGNPELRKNMELLTYFYNDRELNPAIKFKILLPSVPDIELMLGRTSWESIFRREGAPEKEEKSISFGREWRDAYDKSLEPRLDTILSKGTRPEKILALALLPKPHCGEKLQPIAQRFLGALSDPDPVVREMAAYYLRSSLQQSNRNKELPSRLSDPEPYSGASPLPKNPRSAHGFSRQKTHPVSCDSQPIIDALLKVTADSGHRVRMEAALALGFTGEQQAVPALIGMLRDGDPFVRMGAAFALGELRAKDGASGLAALAVTTTGDWRDYFARRESLKALRKIWVAGFRRVIAVGADGEVPQELFDANLRTVAVTTALKAAGDETVRREAFGVLAEIKAPEAAELLISGSGDSDPAVRLSALRGLLRLADDKRACRECGTIFAAAARDDDALVRAAAVSGLGRVTGKERNETLLKAVSDPNETVRKSSVSSIRAVDTKSLEKLAALLDEKQDMRLLALKSLHQATREDPVPAKIRREPAGAAAGRPYMWIEPKTRQNSTAAKGPPTGQDRSHARLHNDAVVGKVMVVFPKLAVEEKVYALEIIGRFEHPDSIPFLLKTIEAPETDVAIKAMEVSMAYDPAASFPRIARNQTARDIRVKEAAAKITAGMAVDLPVQGFAWMAEDKDLEIRHRFFYLARNLSDPALSSLCLKGLRDPSIDIRRMAAECIQKHPDPGSIALLSDMLGSPNMAAAAARALASQDDSVFDLLLGIIADTSGKYGVDVKREALFGIVNHDRDKTVPALMQLLASAPDGPMSGDLVRALVGLRDRRATPALLKLLENGRGDGGLIARGLLTMEDPAALVPLQKIVENPAEPLQKRRWAVMGCAGCGVNGTRYLLDLARRSADLRQVAVESLRIHKAEDRRAAAELAGQNPLEYRDIVAAIGGTVFGIPLEATASLLHDRNPSVVKGAVLLLRATGNPKAIGYLHELDKNRDPALQELLAEAVVTLERKRVELERKKGVKPGTK